ncbi:MAG TPA: GNAT family N-acetyltransferase [Spirochaetota bacterium]|nr:GNAT family N-acetyltransferase [Spirochaetota bacterium]HPJ41462.1 GNAT family N-acetyltransferase [Spirochaetota bacterium]HRX46605.1 GNAT family N-acetyltransferase [Spirochaetota bacterium]
MIRKFKKTDMDSVLDIWLEASIKTHDFIDREFWESNVPAMRDLYLPSAEIYVNNDHGKVNGFIALNGDSVAALFVSPESQGRGIGSRLLNWAKELRGTIELFVYKENVKSFEFYRKHLFAAEGEHVDGRTGRVQILMRW